MYYGTSACTLCFAQGTWGGCACLFSQGHAACFLVFVDHPPCVLNEGYDDATWALLGLTIIGSGKSCFFVTSCSTHYSTGFNVLAWNVTTLLYLAARPFDATGSAQKQKHVSRSLFSRHSILCRLMALLHGQKNESGKLGSLELCIPLHYDTAVLYNPAGERVAEIPSGYTEYLI